MRRLQSLGAASLALLLSMARGQAGEPVADKPPTEVILSTVPAGPPKVAPWAVPGRTDAYSGCYVGGGGGLHGHEPRSLNEGTWGWDYQGCFFLRKIWLKWNHGKAYQGGEGAYKTDGPPITNIFAVPPLPEKSGKDH